MPDLHRDELHATLDRLTKLHGKATPGEWEYDPFHGNVYGDKGVCYDVCDANAEFIAAAHNSFPSLASTIRSQEARIAELERLLGEAEDLPATQLLAIDPAKDYETRKAAEEYIRSVTSDIRAALASMNTEQEKP